MFGRIYEQQGVGRRSGVYFAFFTSGIHGLEFACLNTQSIRGTASIMCTSSNDRGNLLFGGHVRAEFGKAISTSNVLCWNSALVLDTRIDPVRQLEFPRLLAEHFDRASLFE